jgi:hypothetical protein
MKKTSRDAFIPYLMTSETQDCVAVGSEHYYLNLKCFASRNCNNFFFHFINVDYIVNCIHDFASQFSTLRIYASPRRSNVEIAVEVIVHWK